MKRILHLYACVMAGLLVPATALAQTTWYVDDVTDPDEDGSPEHPFDAIQEGIDAADNEDTVLVLDGTYTGIGNKNLDFNGKAITVRSASGDPATCIIDCEEDGRGFYFHSGETRTAVVDGLTITNGLVDDNGGGICCVGSDPTIINCVLSANDAYFGSGGGIHSKGGSPLIKDCRFDDCDCTWMGWTGYGGGGVFCSGGTPEIIGNFFTGCSAHVFCEDGGGAIGFLETDIVIRGNEIVGGYAHGAGGGIAGHDSQVDISHNVIAQCFGFHYGGGLTLWNSSGTVSHNLIIDNETYDRGGGIYLRGNSNVEIGFCTIVDNAAGTPDYGPFAGGGIYVSSSSETLIHHCIIWGNTAGEGEQIHVDEPGVATVSYCDVQGGWPGEGMLDDDPLFVDPENEDFHLSAASPCIDTGDPDFVPQPDETDLDGHARMLCDRVDMGAYEFGIGDYTCDRVVDLTDFASWPACMTGPDAGPYGEGCEAFDFDYDGDVDLFDFAEFQAAFTGEL